MIKATAIVQVLGRPKEHIEQVLKDIAARVDEQGYKTERLELMPVEESEEQDGYYSGLFEVDLELKDHEQLFGFIQDYNPLSVEVTDPDYFEMGLADYNALVSTVAATVQQYDRIVREKINENVAAIKRVDVLIRNLIVLSVASGPKKGAHIRKETGLAEETLRRYLPMLIADGTITKDGEIFTLAKDKSEADSD